MPFPGRRARHRKRKAERKQMENKGNQLLTFFSASKTAKGTGVLLTFVRGEKPSREFFKVFVPYWDVTKGKQPAAWFGRDSQTIMSLRDEPKAYDPKAKAKGNEVGPDPDPRPKWGKDLPL